MSRFPFQAVLNPEQTVCLSGRIDLTNVVDACTQVKQLILRLNKIRIDLSGLEYVDSSSLALLVECIRAAKAEHKDITFCNMPQFMLDLGRVCGLDTILPINKPLQFHS